ncbi:MAG: hypothetical protein MJZ61_00975 [Bacteroidales bacterium]|nr:hypothetical protein [Bacteroidales bacterium]
MSQPIITTDISAIRPVFAEGAGENIQRYAQLKKMFQQGMEYAVLAEPMPDGPNKITWHTEFEGTPAAFSKLTEDEQIAAKTKIKNQVNKLYKAVYKQLYRNQPGDVEDMLRVVDSCLEIPDYDNIYRIQRHDGSCNFVLIKWGFNSDDPNAPTALLRKLIPTRVDTVKIKVIKNTKVATNEAITVVYNGKSADLSTDSKGYVFLEDIPLGDKFSAYAQDKATITDYVCDGSDEYHLLIGTKSADMNFFLSDGKGTPLADAEVSFTYDGRTYFETTDTNGRICLRDIAEGTEVVCKQRNNSQAFICDANTKQYDFHGSRPVAELEVAVLADNGEAVPGINVKLKFNGKDLTVSTDRNGRVSIDNMPPDTEFEIVCSGSQYQTSTAKITTHEGLNMTEIKMRKTSQAGCMTITVTDTKGNPIVNTLVRCEYEDTKVEFFTNDNGEIALNKVPYNTNVVCTQIINGLGSHRHVFTFVPNKDEYVLKGMKILSDTTDLEIVVTNKQKQKVPNLRVTVDDGHNVVNRITNQDGRIEVSGLERGKTYHISTEYSNKTTEMDFVPSKENEKLNILVGRNSIGFLLWLIPLVALLGWLVCSFLIPKMKEMVSTPMIVEDTTHIELPVVDTVKTDTVQAPVVEEPVVLPGITLTISDSKTGNTVAGAKIHLEYDQLDAKKKKKLVKLDAVSDSMGRFNFADVPMDSTLQIKATIKTDQRPDYTAKFLFEPEKTISLPEASLDVRDVPVSCGVEVKSEGYFSTVQAVDVKLPKGKLTIGYNMFDIPDELIVYAGKPSQIADSKIIYKTDGLVKGPFKRATFDYDTPDGIITVQVKGGDKSKTQWYFKVYCPSAPKSTSKSTK